MKYRFEVLAIAAIALTAIYYILRRSTPKIIDLASKLPSAGNYPRRDLSAVKYVTIHHTAGPVTQSPADIARFHIGRGWPGIGYHYLIYPDGTVYQTQPLTRSSYHNGVNNGESAGVTLVGNYDVSEPTDKAINAAVGVLREIKRQTGAGLANGHGDLKPTACPGKNTPVDKIIRAAGFRRATPTKTNRVAGGWNDQQSDN